MANERILALDIASLTGICVGSPTEIPQLSHHRFPSTGSDIGRFLDAGEVWVRSFLQTTAPALVVFEAPVLPQTTSIATVRKLHGLAGIIEMGCYRAGIEVAEAHLQSVKKALTGKGNAQKPDMVAACRRYGFDPKVEDEADAFGVWLLTVRTRHPTKSHAWDPINFQGLRA